MYNFDYDFLRQINLHQNFKIVTDVWNGESRELLSHKYCKGTLTSLLQNQSMENFYENRYIWIWVIWKCTISRKDYWFHLRTERANFKSVPGLNFLQAFFTYNSCAHFKIKNIYTKCEVKITPKGTANPDESKQERSKQDSHLFRDPTLFGSQLQSHFSRKSQTAVK